MIKKSIERETITAEYERTSSGGQELKLQRNSNSEYIKEHGINKVKPFTDFDVSATKLSIEDRPALNRMLKLVKEGIIKRVITYNRDRIARNVYEYVYIVKLFYEYDVEVIFTASKAPPFSHDLFIETWYGLNAQYDGQNIGARTGEARKRNPPQLIGYKKIIKESSDNMRKERYYQAIDGVKEKINNLFKDVSNSDSLADLFNVIVKYEDLLNRDADRIIGILNTPFFAAHYFGRDNTLKPLTHVEPIISLALFNRVQKVLEQFEKGINKGRAIKTKEAFINPICGNCKQKLKFKPGIIGQSGHYQCSKHKGTIIGIDEFEIQMISALNQHLKELDTEKLEKIPITAINKQITLLNKEAKEKLRDLDRTCIEIATRFSPNEQSVQLTKQMNKLIVVREKVVEIEDKVRDLQQLKVDMELIKDNSRKSFMNLEEDESNLLVELLTYKVEVHEDLINFHFYLNEFVRAKDGQDVIKKV
ncbi:recombinase family protein [Mesobacillus maritimus]|uniref:recombinase family protein n=1 Tax=Mesobacillus maritimus TaxID=1643336 RepID=UPI0020408F84|nr:recombinase family protein [Mesobacillus maritimus]MCM3669814.1 recombinase family protein [Mesobacillus maritimus]